jgi:hypothetical protein
MAVRVLPDKNTLEKWLEEGLTQQQMVERVEETTGHRVTRAAISMALRRHGFERQKNRWDELLPWRIKTEHLNHPYAQRLRELSRRKAGVGNSPAQDRTLDNWLVEMEAHNAVVMYVYDSPEGFYAVPRREADGDGEYDMIRKPTE